jgi:hypothetical protein
VIQLTVEIVIELFLPAFFDERKINNGGQPSRLQLAMPLAAGPQERARA